MAVANCDDGATVNFASNVPSMKIPRPPVEALCAERERADALGFHVHDQPLAFDLAGADDSGAVTGDGAESFEDLREDDKVGGTGLILDRHEDDPRRRPGALADQHKPRDIHRCSRRAS